MEGLGNQSFWSSYKNIEQCITLEYKSYWTTRWIVDKICIHFELGQDKQERYLIWKKVEFDITFWIHAYNEHA